jgi:hypothetical protein
MALAPRRPRERFGAGRLAHNRDKAVFINCPFDPEFELSFDAIVFATICSGFIPRTALESGDVAVPRIERILDAIFTSKYSIHDLSRCRGEGSEQLARFNMPLELGMAMASRFKTPRGQARHDWLVLVPEGHSYARFVSDLAGYDPARHDGTPATLVPKVMSWLATRPDAFEMPAPQVVLRALPRFREEKRNLLARWGSSPPWADVVIAGIEILSASPGIGG